MSFFHQFFQPGLYPGLYPSTPLDAGDKSRIHGFFE